MAADTDDTGEIQDGIHTHTHTHTHICWCTRFTHTNHMQSFLKFTEILKPESKFKYKNNKQKQE